MGHSPLLAEVLLLLACSVPVVLLFHRLRLPSLAAYLTVGAVLGPHALGWIGSTERVDALAEIGVAILLFTVGLEFSIPRLFAMGRRLAIVGGGQVALSIAGLASLAALFGASLRVALFVGVLGALSSTALVLKTLSDRRELGEPHGQLAVGVCLFQDLAVIPLMLALPLLAGAGGTGPVGVAVLLGKAVVAVGIVVFTARYGFSKLAAVVVRAGGRELFVILIVLTVIGAAWLSEVLGLPLAVGAFVAGLVISESEYSHHVVSEILPFRDVLSALFFVSVGMLFDGGLLLSEPAVAAGMACGLLAVKGGVLFALVFFVTRSRRTALLVGAALFQLGEFSFVVAQQAGGLEVLGERGYQRFLAVAVLTMLATPFVLQLAPLLAARLAPKGADAQGVALAAESGGPDVLIAGYGVCGQHLVRVLKVTGISFRVLELSPDNVRKGRAAGVPIEFGDVGRADALERAGLAGAKVLVVAVSDPTAARRAVTLARSAAPSVRIVVRTRYLAEIEELMRLGADQVIPEEFETSVEIFSQVLRELHVPRGTIAVQAEVVRREGYQLLRAPDARSPSLEAIGQILAETSVDTFFVAGDHAAVGRSLGEMGLRRRSGATVVAAARSGKAVEHPGADFRVLPGDLLVLLARHAQLDAARELLEKGLPEEGGEENPGKGSGRAAGAG